MKALAISGILVALALVAAGCAETSGGNRSLAVPLSPQAWHRADIWGVGARFVSADRLAFLTTGSPSCPPAPYRLTVHDRHSITINLARGSWRRPPRGWPPGVPSTKPALRCDGGGILEPVAVDVDPARIDVHHRLKISLYYDATGDSAAPVRPVVLTAPPLAALSSP